MLVATACSIAGCGASDSIQDVREQIRAGQFAESLESLRELIGADPDDPELLFLYGRVLVEMGQPGLADWPLRKAMEDPLWYERSARVVARVEGSGGNMGNAAAIYADILERDPSNLEVRLLRANVCARSPGLYEEALAEVDRILEISPDELGAFKPRILAYLSLNMPEEAGQAMEELGTRIEERKEEEIGDDSIRGWYCATMAIFAAESGDEELASERWAVCEEDFPAHANVVGQSIEFHKARGELQRAFEVAEIAFSADPEADSGYRLIMGDLLRDLGRPRDAEELLLEAAATDDSTRRATALLALTEHYKAIGDMVAAAESLEQGLILTQQNMGPQPDLLFALADILIQIGDGERALELTRQMTVAPHRSLVRARVAHERKQYVKALELYEETSRLWPDNPYAPYHAGRAAMSAAQFDRAFQSFLMAIRIEDGATDARCRAGRLMDAEGQSGSALELLSGGRVGTPPDCQLLKVEILARTKGPAVGFANANLMSQQHPAYFGRAVAAAARGVRESGNMRGAWGIVEPLLSLDFTPQNRLAVLQAAVESAPGDDELALVRPGVRSAVESDGDSASTREIEGMLLERSAALDQAAASYRLAIEGDSGHISALLRLARLTAADQPQEAIELIERALTQQERSNQPLETDLLLAAISELPQSPAVEPLLVSGLRLAPSSGRIALRLAMLVEASGGDDERILGLASRAIRFQQGEKAVALRDLVQARRKTGES
jgi:tetratricopeptide (TPR) repeat protein